MPYVSIYALFFIVMKQCIRHIVNLKQQYVTHIFPIKKGSAEMYDNIGGMKLVARRRKTMKEVRFVSFFFSKSSYMLTSKDERAGPRWVYLVAFLLVSYKIISSFDSIKYNGSDL